MSKGTLDHETLQAVGVLKRAVEQARVTGVLEFRLLVAALERTLESRSVRELDEAKRVFDTLDGEIRARVVEYANEAARAEAGIHGARGPVPVAEPEAKRTALRKAVRSATGFLAALNGARGGAQASVEATNPGGAPDSRVTAKSRLLAAVEERRENDLTAARLLSGGPLSPASWTS
ncbi:hypothetical protein [Azospirillum rugosum]|uniref:Uncharacterized protein n=1 Tax=Azospirillum rugosum TaxID=416170 RepID=A0ABS4SGV5_9PROT|nr:hypothetical protein [Azospirillum rugosum]MBP2291797.1 hypothetical protein [Azospirillum rugosum]MDQ0524391.1 hypothetical protein [Azospirillum rugosum]